MRNKASSSAGTPSTLSSEDPAVTNPVTYDYFQHSSAKRINTDLFIFRSIQERHPSENITVVPDSNCDLLGFAATGHAIALPVDDKNPFVPTSVKWHRYFPPRSRLDGGHGGIGYEVIYGEYKYAYADHDFYVYLVDGRDGTTLWNQRNYYIVGSKEACKDLIMASGQWISELHDEMWVFNQGYWQKDPELYKSIQKASWDDVILDEERKSALIADVDRFFDSRDTYLQLRVPWKRGLIFYGPPGNGKTISIKATSHSLYARKDPIPTLYVRSLASFGGPEYAIASIFLKARQTAPCLLVFEDLDSIVTDGVRSFFLNEVDGLTSNDGILMIGSTNHLERLDPGISKRPSRFDRKYPFPNPDEDERVQYCEFWRRKLQQNKDIDFPHKLSVAISKITYDFSFAYIQEAFVAALLEIAAHKSTAKMATEPPRLTRSSNDLLQMERSHIRGLYAVIVLLQTVLLWKEPWLLVAFTLLGVPLCIAYVSYSPGSRVEVCQRMCQRLLSNKINSSSDHNDDDDDLKDNILWQAIKSQVKLLRKALGDDAIEVL